ncbi:hypothetical protein [Priestia megaterium]|uniref:hypothetical protein n=1 Tax=Priestia megaterium TaxID=1404 RepID=UPI002E245E5D|nr:hypothetical protein [Priestia megaterium]
MKETFKKDWFKIIISILAASLVGLILWKVINADFNFKFNFNDFLSLILALFSIGLSVAFYFKATDQSDQFYQNSLKLTKDLSVLLGKIEARFGENLRHLEEGNSRLQSKLDSISEKQIRLRENEDVVSEYVEIKQQIENLLQTSETEDSSNNKEKVKELENLLQDLEKEIKFKENTIDNLKGEIKKQKKSDLEVEQLFAQESFSEILKLRNIKGSNYARYVCPECSYKHHISENILLNNKIFDLSHDDGYITKIKCPRCESVCQRLVLHQ